MTKKHKRVDTDSQKRRKGPTAMSGEEPFPTIYVRNERKPKGPKKPPFSTPLTIAQLWGNEAPPGEMSKMRAERAAKILARKKKNVYDE